MTPLQWLIIYAAIFGSVLVIFALITIASDEGDVADERDCRATVDRSNGLSDDVLTWANCERAIEEMMAPKEPIDMLGQPIMGFGNVTYRDAFAFIHKWQLYEKENGVTMSFGEARKMFGKMEGFSDYLEVREE